MICGAIAVSSHCGALKPWSSFITGCLAGVCYSSMCYLMKVTYHDDSMETFSIYGTAAVLAALFGPIFYPEDGAIYGSPKSGVMIGVQFMGLVSVLGWSGVISSIYFFATLRLGYLKLSIAE